MQISSKKKIHGFYNSMQITHIQNGLINRTFSFQRKLKENEKADYQKAMEDGFQAAGVKQRVAITHGSVFPAVGRDTFVGSPYSEAAKKYIEFLKLNGFNGNQLGPNGTLSTKNEEQNEKGLKSSLSFKKERSPYNTSAFSENKLFLDLNALTTDKYGKLLSSETYNKLSVPIIYNDKNYAFSNFNKADVNYTSAINEICSNFQKNIAAKEPNTLRLKEEFKEFLRNNGKKTEEEGLFKALAAKYNSENPEEWSDSGDADLMTEIRKNDPFAIQRYQKLKIQYNDTIRTYQFEQFLLNKQIKENKEFRDKLGFKYFSDLLIGCSQMDKWRYKEAFLEGYSIGAYEYDPNTPHQTWNIPVLNPRMIFKNENELNIGGVFLKEKIEHALENCENVRVDHVLGLIDPFVYEEATLKKDFAGKQIKHLLHGDFMSKITTSNGDKLDDYASYPQILQRIIIPALKEKNLNTSDPVWESICCEPDMFKKIYHNELHLPRLASVDYEKLETSDPKNWYILGSHDTIPAMNMLRADGGARRSYPSWAPEHLAGYLFQDPARIKEKQEFEQKISDQKDGTEKIGDELRKADRERVIAKFAQLFTNEKIQVSFDDILGINDKNITYNVGGSDNNFNWKERISPDFIDKYYENLASDNPTALNIPEILEIAVHAKIDMEVNRSENKDAKRTELQEKYKPLLDQLAHWTSVLKEKE